MLFSSTLSSILSSSMYSNVSTSTRINSSSVHTYVHPSFNMVSEKRLYLHLFSKENIWSNPQQFPAYIHTSSHPDKYNKSVDRIISKEEEREDPRRDTSVFFEYSGVSTYNPFYKNYSVSTRNPASFQSSRAKTTILHTELILLQEFSKKYYNYKAHPMQIITRHLPVIVLHTSKHSTWQNKAPLE